MGTLIRCGERRIDLVGPLGGLVSSSGRGIIDVYKQPVVVLVDGGSVARRNDENLIPSALRLVSAGSGLIVAAT